MDFFGGLSFSTPHPSSQLAGDYKPFQVVETSVLKVTKFQASLESGLPLAGKRGGALDPGRYFY